MKNIIRILVLLTVVSAFAQKNEHSIFKKLNFDKSQLSKVKNQYERGNEDRALKELLDLYRRKENLYLKVSKEDANFLKKNYIKGVNKSINTANEVLNQYFLFRDDWDMEKTNIPHQFEGEIDWKASPNGDMEWCYMLNRHKYWIDLGKAYLLTGNEKYAKGFVKQVTHWINNNPLEDSLKNYSWRGIEAGIRCENWIKAFEYMKDSKHITPEFLSLFLNSLYQHGAFINSSFNYFSQTSNHGILQYQGAFNVALFLNDFKVAPQWQSTAIANLKTCINLQILDDGSQWEQSPMYHNEVLHCYMNVNLLAQRNNILLPPEIVEKTKAMAHTNVKWQKPNFHQPLLGDSDDTDLRGMLTLASVLFNDSELKSRGHEKLDYENLFLTGLDYNKTYENMASKTPDYLSIYQQSSGDFYMRSSWEEDATYTSLHLKKLGCGHGHDNILHFTIFANNQDYLIDSGRYSYVNNKWREFFKSSISHNTLGVDNLPNTIYNNSWSNSFEARSQGVFVKPGNNFDYAEAENIAYKRLEDPVSMKRRMLYLKPNIWLIFDSFSANGTHKYSQYFNFPDKNIEISNHGLTTTFPKNNLRIQPINDVQIELSDSWFSSEYNLKTENKRAELFKNETGFTSFISLLYFPELDKVTYKKQPVYSRGGSLVSSKDAEAVTIYLDDKTFTLFVVHNSSAPANHFYKVNDVFVYGEVVLIETHNNKSKSYIIK